MDEQQAEQFLHGFSVLGVPLLAAIQEVIAWEDGNLDPLPDRQAKTARRFNELMTATIVLSSRIASKLELQESDMESGLRLKAGEIAARLVAEHFRLEGEAPDEAALSVLLESVEPLMAVADSVAPLQMKHMDGPAAPLLITMKALFPLQQALTRFSFGQDPRELGLRVAQSLDMRVRDVTEALAASMPAATSADADRRRTEVLRGCAGLLTAIVENEQQDERYADSLPPLDAILDRIFETFDANLALLRQMLGFMLGIDRGGAAVSSGSSSRNVKPAADKEKKEAGKKANPMSFFVKKQSGGMGK